MSKDCDCDALKRENKMLTREIERLRARLATATDKELSLLNAILAVKEQLREYQDKGE